MLLFTISFYVFQPLTAVTISTYSMGCACAIPARKTLIKKNPTKTTPPKKHLLFCLEKLPLKD